MLGLNMEQLTYCFLLLAAILDMDQERNVFQLFVDKQNFFLFVHLVHKSFKLISFIHHHGYFKVIQFGGPLIPLVHLYMSARTFRNTCPEI